MIKILLVEDHELVRLGVKRLLQDIPGFKIIGEACTGEDAVRLAKELIPDVILMDIQLSGISGLEAMRKIVRYNPDVKILVLTIYTQEPYPSRALQAGAAGYITKDCTTDEMIDAIRKVHSGQCYMGREIAQKLAFKHFSKTPDAAALDRLSERELQIMLMITKGEQVQDISAKLYINSKTINGYRYSIFEKLKIKSDVEMTLLAIRLGLVEDAIGL